MSAWVDARFAGGTVLIDTGMLPSAEETGVLVRIPGGELPLRPDEARKLAIALIEYAHRAEKPHDNWPDDEISE